MQQGTPDSKQNTSWPRPNRSADMPGICKPCPPSIVKASFSSLQVRADLGIYSVHHLIRSGALHPMDRASERPCCLRFFEPFEPWRLSSWSTFKPQRIRRLSKRYYRSGRPMRFPPISAALGQHTGRNCLAFMVGTTFWAPQLDGISVCSAPCPRVAAGLHPCYGRAPIEKPKRSHAG